jgi:hypothetical protein
MRGTLLGIGGAFILASAFLHAIVNVPHLRADMIEIGMRPTLLRAVSLVLWFSVVAMFGFAALVLQAAAASLRGGAPRAAPLWIVSAAYVAFGIVASVAVAPSPHFLGYTAMGLLVAAGTLLEA